MARKNISKKRNANEKAPQKPSSLLGTQAFLHSLGVIAYIAFVAFLMTNAEKQFDGANEILGPIAFLMLFTLSAAIVGLLIFGRPVMLYLDGKKHEALQFCGYIIGMLFAEALIAFVILAVANV